MKLVACVSEAFAHLSPHLAEVLLLAVEQGLKSVVLVVSEVEGTRQPLHQSLINEWDRWIRTAWATRSTGPLGPNLGPTGGPLFNQFVPTVPAPSPTRNTTNTNTLIESCVCRLFIFTSPPLCRMFEGCHVRTHPFRHPSRAVSSFVLLR